MPRKQKAAGKVHGGLASNRRHRIALPVASHANDDGRGHVNFDTRDDDAPPSSPVAADADQALSGAHIKSVSTAAPKASGEASHDASQDQSAPASPLAPAIAEIRLWHRQRVFAMDQRKRSDLALGSFLRTQFGWSRNIPKAEADIASERARDLIALGEKIAKGKETGIGNPDHAQLGAVVMASINGRSHWDAIEGVATKEMERLAKSLPVWPAFGEPIKGFGARSLAVIVGEAGDLSLYANPAKLWKRMGLAVMDGVRQGGLRKSAGKEEWIAHGYNAKRRSFMFVIGDVLVKNQSEYRELYLQRKEIERGKAEAAGLTVAPAAKIPEKRKHEFMSDGHVHRRAQRYMEKRLLRDLWRAWRRANGKMLPEQALPAANSSASAEGQTIQQATPSIPLSAPTPSAQAERRAKGDATPNLELPAASSPNPTQDA